MLRRARRLPRWQPDIGCHPRFEYAMRITHADLESKHLMPPLIDRLHVSRREFAGRGDVRDLAFESLAGKRITCDFDFLPQMNLAQRNLRNICFHPEVVGT